jgi:hypothetical protein
MIDIKMPDIKMIDITKLITYKSYSKKIGCSRQWIYMQAAMGRLKTIEIDGVKFIYEEPQ